MLHKTKHYEATLQYEIVKESVYIMQHSMLKIVIESC